MIEPTLPVLALAAALAIGSVAQMCLTAWLRAVDAREHPRPDNPPRTDWPTVSVIVPAWREREVLGRCLDALGGVDYPSWELLVIAGGDDGTHAVAVEASQRLPHAAVLEQGPLGKPAALNAGVRASSGEIVVFLDADSVVAPGWLRALVRPIRGDVRASTGNPSPSRSTAVSRVELMERIVVYDIRRSPILQGSGSIAVDRRVLEELEGFPLDAYADDWDLDARLAVRGIDRAYAPDAALATERPATFREYWWNEVRWRRAHLISLFSLPEYFFRDLGAVLRSLYPYLVAWAWALLTIAAIATVGLVLARGTGGDQDAWVPTVLGLWVIAGLWILAQRLALVIQVVAYTRDRRWLRDGWAASALFVVTLLAACVASVTTRRATLHFKGPRRVVEDESGL